MSNANINTMDLKQLRNEVQLLRDELAIMKRKYEDILYNLDDANFSDRFVKEKDNMKTAITVTAEGIKTLVTKDEFESEMMETASLIATKVSNTELGKYSTTAQTVDAIQTVVSKGANLDDAIPIVSLDYATDRNAVYVIRSTDALGNITGERYYYYNDLLNQWEILSGDSIYTVFNQTASGFELKGNVTIDGSLVTNISKVNDALYLGSDTDEYSKKIVFNESSSITSILDNSLLEVGVEAYTALDIKATDISLSTVGTISLYGILDLTSVTKITWGENAPEASGGTAVAVFG